MGLVRRALFGPKYFGKHLWGLCGCSFPPLLRRLRAALLPGVRLYEHKHMLKPMPCCLCAEHQTGENGAIGCLSISLRRTSSSSGTRRVGEGRPARPRTIQRGHSVRRGRQGERNQGRERGNTERIKENEEEKRRGQPTLLPQCFRASSVQKNTRKAGKPYGGIQSKESKKRAEKKGSQCQAAPFPGCRPTLSPSDATLARALLFCACLCSGEQVCSLRRMCPVHDPIRRPRSGLRGYTCAPCMGPGTASVLPYWSKHIC